VVRTRVGYAGGETPEPTYHAIAGHSEALEVVFDADLITYEALVRVFWQSHRPYNKSWSRQYRSAIFYATEQEKRTVERIKQDEEQKRGATLYTDIEGAGPFWKAEDYHQKYILQQKGSLVRSLRRQFGADWDETYAATKLNAQAAGYATPGYRPLEAPSKVA